MNPIEHLRDRLSQRFPNATLTLDSAASDSGTWFLDVLEDEHHVMVQWNPRTGLGISTPSEDDFGARPDEVFQDVEAALLRAKTLLISRTRTRAPIQVHLNQLRQLRDLSQVELAARLAINQASLSKMERRSDMLVGTLRSLVAAMGGELEIRAKFRDSVVTLDLAGVTDESR